MENFDFIQGFVGFDILQAEAVSKIVSRMAGVAIREMMDVGLTEDQAIKVFNSAIKTALTTTIGNFK